MKKRLRIYAGPNGSGKSVLHKKLSTVVNNGFFVNADVIYNELGDKTYYDFDNSGLNIDDNLWQNFVLEHGLYSQISALKESHVVTNILTCSEKFNSYDVAVLADFIRYALLEKGDSFSCETVFSHPSKLELLTRAKDLGYRTYLYFCCAGDAVTCVERVRQRVSEGGHDVPEDKIEQRFNRTLDNLLAALKLVDRAYVFDNSGKEFELVIEVDGNELKVKSDYVPNWVNESVITKVTKIS